MNQKKEFKPNPEVLARMAEAFARNSAVKKTHLHFASRTDWNSFLKYLRWMQQKNYIEYCDSTVTAYQLTPGGREIFSTILDLYDNVKKFRSIIDA